MRRALPLVILSLTVLALQPFGFPARAGEGAEDRALSGEVQAIFDQATSLALAAAFKVAGQAIDGGRREAPSEILLPFDVHTPENV